MQDLINRQDAIDACLNGFCACVSDCVDEIEKLPSAEPVQKTGKWIHREDMDFIDQNDVQHIHLMCENCGLIHDFFDGHTGQYKYCPNCGSRMVGEEDG